MATQNSELMATDKIVSVDKNCDLRTSACAGTYSSMKGHSFGFIDATITNAKVFQDTVAESDNSTYTYKDFYESKYIHTDTMNYCNHNAQHDLMIMHFNVRSLQKT